MVETSYHYLGERGKAYFVEKFTGRYDLGRIYQSRYYRPYCSDDRVLLDFGCGDGTLLRELAADKKIGVEINPHCRNKIVEINKYIQQELTVYDSILHVGDSTINVAISNHCLEHTPNPLESLKQIRRVLVPGGIFVTVTPFDDWRQKDHRHWRPFDKQNHLFTWSPLNLGNLLSEAGFEVLETRLSTTAWSPKIFWIYRLFGETGFKIACHFLSLVKRRREIFARCRKPECF